jgi:hypothetical protein
MNEINAIYLITTTFEYENGRLFLFLKKMIKYNLCKEKIPFVVFFDKKINEMYEKKILLTLDFLGYYEHFSEIEIVNNDIPDELNIYTHQLLDVIPKYGTSSGPNLHFLHTVQYKTMKHPIVFIIETDCVFIKNDAIDIMNKSIYSLDFWIYGSKYYGNVNLEKRYKHHMNGVGLYNRVPEFLTFIETTFQYIADMVETRSTHIINYDIAIHNCIDKIKKRYLFIDSQEIINISTKEDAEITVEECLMKKPNTLLIHQKIENNEIKEDEFLLQKMLTLNYIHACYKTVKNNTVLHR